MDYFQGVVIEFLRAKRTTFVNTEYLLQLDEGDVYARERHWYCDVVAVDHLDRTVQLCEVTYSKTLQGVFKRLQGWCNHWPAVDAALRRDSALVDSWTVRPHVFIPREAEAIYERKLSQLVRLSEQTIAMPDPQVTYMEDVLPWLYRSWNQKRYKEAEDV